MVVLVFTVESPRPEQKHLPIRTHQEEEVVLAVMKVVSVAGVVMETVKEVVVVDIVVGQEVMGILIKGVAVVHIIMVLIKLHM